MEYGLPIFCLFAIFLGAVSAKNTTVTIYFESLCPDSKKFIVNQFSVAYLEKGLKDYVLPDFVPYGHRNETANTCQHGEVECFGNVLLACAINKIPSVEGQVKFVQCVMNTAIPKNITIEEGENIMIKQCKDVAGNLSSAIENCSKSDEGKKLNLEYKTRTENFFGNSSFGVPYIAINNNKNDSLSGQFEKDFLHTFCKESGENIKACKSGNSASALTASLIPAVLALILARL